MRAYYIIPCPPPNDTRGIQPLFLLCDGRRLSVRRIKNEHCGNCQSLNRGVCPLRFGRYQPDIILSTDLLDHLLAILFVPGFQWRRRIPFLIFLFGNVEHFDSVLHFVKN